MGKRDTGAPHVTGVLKTVGLQDLSFCTEFHRDRGTAVHRATALDDVGQLDESTVDKHVAPYLESWRKFRATGAFRIIEIEKQRRNRLYDYVGTPDRLVLWRPTQCKTVIDLKSGGPERWHQLQTAAYAMLYKFPVDRLGVYLQADGSIAKVKPHNDRADMQAYLASLALANWMNTKGR